jgi:hypothetical protein
MTQVEKGLRDERKAQKEGHFMDNSIASLIL